MQQQILTPLSAKIVAELLLLLDVTYREDRESVLDVRVEGEEADEDELGFFPNFPLRRK